ncbi:MAG: Lrp/AsnC family transcriptional regulator [Actinobacteria bacterium]|nr:Lrp/AsnC family transcriptional regulator [Actinomycetota bacterium]
MNIDDVKKEILRELKERWQEETRGNCVFVSATERRNLDQLRQTVLNKVQAIPGITRTLTCPVAIL